MGVVFTHHLADAVGGFLMGLVRSVAHGVHAEQHTSLHGLEAITGIGEGARHDNAHRVIDVRALHFIFYINFYDAVIFQHICKRVLISQLDCIGFSKKR